MGNYHTCCGYNKTKKRLANMKSNKPFRKYTSKQVKQNEVVSLYDSYKVNEITEINTMGIHSQDKGNGLYESDIVMIIENTDKVYEKIEEVKEDLDDDKNKQHIQQDASGMSRIPFTNLNNYTQVEGNYDIKDDYNCRKSMRDMSNYHYQNSITENHYSPGKSIKDMNNKQNLMRISHKSEMQASFNSNFMHRSNHGTGFIDAKLDESEDSQYDISYESRHSDPHAVLINKGNEAILSIMVMSMASYDNYEKIHEEKKALHKLKIYIQSYVNTEKNRINKVRSEFYVPCLPEQFVSFMNNMIEQNKLDGNMSEFKRVESFNNTDEQDYIVLYLAYKKMLIASARDFVYLKHYKKINDTTWCEGATSIMYKDIPQYKDKIRGLIILSGYVATLEINPLTDKKLTKIKLYSECDFKSNVPMFMAKSFTIDQTKKYVEKSISRIIELYGKGY